MTSQNTFLKELLRFERPARRVVETGLMLALAVLAGKLFWLVVAPMHVVAKPDPYQGFPPLIGTTQAEAQLEADRTLLMRLNPFGGGEAEQVAPAAPETSLNLVLAGVFMSSADRVGSAVIQTPDGSSRSYSVGESVMSGVTLDRILSDRVILLRNGTAEALMLRGRVEGLSVIGASGEDAAPSVPSDASAPTEINGRIADPYDLVERISFTPVERDGRLMGLQVAPRGSANVLQEAGLVPGDVITRISGETPDSQRIAQILADLGTGDVLELEVDRQGTRVFVSLQVGIAE